jgi:cytochrome P450
VSEVVESDASTATNFRLTEPDVAKDPGEFFEELRSKCPVAHSDDFNGFWMLSRYTDVHEAALNTGVFSSAKGITIPVLPQPPVMCLEQDDPEHRKYRKPMQGWFTAKRIQELEPKVREIVMSRIDEVIDERHGDLAAIIAKPVPIMVIGLILGLPEEDWDWFYERGEERLRLAQLGDEAGSAAAAQATWTYLQAKLEERRQSPRNDMLSEIVSVTIDDKPISEQDAVSLAFLILGAGHETTVAGIGGLIYQVAKDSRIRDQLVADPSLIEQAVEEALRLESPLMGLGRITTDEAVVEGVAMPPGERVMLLWGAANRDPAVFDSPEDYRLDRDNVHKHIAFGAGVHRCVGAPLARMEMRIVLEEVLRRMPALRLADPASVRVKWTVAREFEGLLALW